MPSFSLKLPAAGTGALALRAARVRPAFALADGAGDAGPAAEVFAEPVCRSYFVRVAWAKLSAAGLLAALAAVAAPKPDRALGAALAAAVCAVASVHYSWLHAVRTQRGGGWNRHPWALRAVTDADADAEAAPLAGGAGAGASVGQKLFAQEVAADAIRSSDWVCTLALLTVHLQLLCDEANPTAAADSLLDSIALAATCAACVPALGLVPKAYYNQLRPIGGKTSQPLLNVLVAALCTAGSVALFVLVSVDTLRRAGPLAGRSADAQTTVLVVRWATLVQIGYPLVALADFALVDRERDDTYAAALSTGKDVAYAARAQPTPRRQLPSHARPSRAAQVLDTSVKAGLALYAALHARN